MFLSGESAFRRNGETANFISEISLTSPVVIKRLVFFSDSNDQSRLGLSSKKVRRARPSTTEFSLMMFISEFLTVSSKHSLKSKPILSALSVSRRQCFSHKNGLEL